MAFFNKGKPSINAGKTKEVEKSFCHFSFGKKNVCDEYLTFDGGCVGGLPGVYLLMRAGGILKGES